MSVSNPSEKKLNKKLKAFIKDKSPNVKRFKTLVTYTESSPDVAEEKQFFEENSELIFAVFFDKWLELEGIQKKGKSHAAEVLSALGVLKKFLVYLEPQIKKKWKYDKIGTIIQQSLASGNKHSVRLLAFELLILFIQDLQTPSNENIDEQIALFSCSINLKPFVSSIQAETNSMIKLKNLPPEVKEESLICPSNGESSKSDALELLTLLLEYMSNVPDNFQFWFLIFKEFYLSVFYPKIFQEMGILYKNDDTGFQMYCPYEIQTVLINFFTSWSENATISRILWDVSNAPLMIEISKQSCLLPMSYAETVKKSIDVYKNWLTTTTKWELFGNKTQSYWKSYIKNILLVFSVRSSGEEIASQQQICKQSLNVLSGFSTELSSRMENDTWEVLQNALLNCAFEFVHRIDKSPQEQALIAVADPLFQTLFFIWIKSEVTTKEMWTELQKKLSALTHWKSLIVQWKEKIIQLTYILKDFIYSREVDLLGGPKHKLKVSTTVPRDAKLDSITWNEDRITESWFILLDILGNINKINESLNHEIAMSAMREAIELLIQAEEETLQYDEPGPIPLYGVFLPVLLECCSLNVKFVKGMLIAYSTMGLLFLYKRQYKPIDTNLLSHYYRVIYNGLNTGKEQIIWEIINSCKNLFSLGLPGVYVLIPIFLREIDRLFNSALLSNTLPEIDKNALTIVNSLICIPDHFDNIKIPTVEDQIMDSSTIRNKISSILVSAINRDNASVKQLCCWGMCVLICQDLYHSPRKETISSIVSELLSVCSHPNADVACTALEVFGILASLYEKIQSLDSVLPNMIIGNLCDNVVTLIAKAKSSPLSSITSSASSSSANLTSSGSSGNTIENVIMNHYYCLCEWLVGGSTSNILSNSELTLKYCTALEYGLFGDLLSKDKAAFDNKKDTSKKEGSKRKPIYPIDSYYLQLRNKPSHGSQDIREAAEILLLYTLNHYNNFPTSAGPEQIVSEFNEEDDNKHIFFIYNDTSIISLSEINNNGNTISRIIVRDYTGKYAWDCNISFDSLQSKISRFVKESSSVLPTNAGPSSSSANETKTESTYSRSSGQMPMFSSETKNQQVNVLEELLHYLGETHSECLPPTNKVGSFFKPYIPSGLYKDQIEITSSSLEEQHNKEKEKIKETSLIQRPSLTSVPEEIVSISSFQQSRLLLSQFGFLSMDNLKRFCMVDDNARFRRSLKDLDRISGRQVLKIGVVYVAEAQEEQRAIFKNDAGSKEYNDFLLGLGWSVDLKTHKGFLGGLDATCGASAPYWANASYEVIFHCATRMPTIDTDPQQIQKKRHVGNDIVHIIWSEHCRDYHPATITSQFNDAHVIIYPLNSGLYRIQIYRKDKVTFFGPLCDGMVINKELLPFLVRFTAMNATMNVRYSTKGYKRSFTAREDFIKEVIKRYKIDVGFEDYLYAFFPLNGDDSWKSKHMPLSPEEDRKIDENQRTTSTSSLGDDSSNTDSISTHSSLSNIVSPAKPVTTTTTTTAPTKPVTAPPTTPTTTTAPPTKASTAATTAAPTKATSPPVMPPPRNVPKPDSDSTKKEEPKATTTTTPVAAPTVSNTTTAKPKEEDKKPVSSTPTTPATTEDKDEKKKAGLFGFMKKKDNKKEEVTLPNTPPTSSPTTAPTATSTTTTTAAPTTTTTTTTTGSPTTTSNSQEGSGNVSGTGTIGKKGPAGNAAFLQQLNKELSSKSVTGGSSPILRTNVPTPTTPNPAPTPAPTATTTTAANNTPPPTTQSPSSSGVSLPATNNSPTTSPSESPTVSRQNSDVFESGTIRSYEELKNKRNIEGLDSNRLELYLSDDEFERVFQSNKEQFKALPLWKQNTKKRQLGLL